MDPVRLGRALGIGARSAAKTVVHAVDAATAPNPATAPHPAAPRHTASSPGAERASHPNRAAAARTAPSPGPRTPAASQARAAASQLKAGTRGLREGSRRFRTEAWSPFVRLSGVLWLEVTGVFFGIFAAFAMAAAWRLRSAWNDSQGSSPGRQRLLGALVMLVVFGYFSVSSFLRAKRRERGR